MARLIDADALVELVKGHGCDKCPGGALQCTFCTLSQFIAMIDSAPAIDAAPVRRGEWVTDDDNNDDWAEPYCKKCGCSIPCGPAHFCPNCGADMRKEEHHEPED